MKITLSNFKKFAPTTEQPLLKALLYDIDSINKLLDNITIYIDWQDYHNEYSTERVDPCPDYYGYYSIKFDGFNYQIVGDKMTIDELDNALLLLNDYTTFLSTYTNNKKEEKD